MSIFNHDYVGKFPEGSIRHIRDLMYGIQERGGCTVYTVGQRGIIEEITFDEDAFVQRTSWGAYYIEYQEDCAWSPGRRTDKFFLDDRGVSWGDSEVPSHTCHRTFFDKKKAEEYANWMKNDSVYQQNVSD